MIWSIVWHGFLLREIKTHELNGQEQVIQECISMVDKQACELQYIHNYLCAFRAVTIS